MARETARDRIWAFRASRADACGDDSASMAEFERLYRESFPSVYGSVLFRMRDEEAARDVTSEAFLRAARNFSRYDPKKAKFSTWVNVIARNCVIDYYRTRKEHASIDDAPEAALADRDDLAQRVADADLARKLLATLNEDDRQIVFLKFCEGWTSAEIGDELGMNPSTVATRAHRAILKMRAEAEKISKDSETSGR